MTRAFNGRNTRGRIPLPSGNILHVHGIVAGACAFRLNFVFVLLDMFFEFTLLHVIREPLTQTRIRGIARNSLAFQSETRIKSQIQRVYVSRTLSARCSKPESAELFVLGFLWLILPIFGHIYADVRTCRTQQCTFSFLCLSCAPLGIVTATSPLEQLEVSPLMDHTEETGVAILEDLSVLLMCRKNILCVPSRHTTQCYPLVSPVPSTLQTARPLIRTAELRTPLKP